MKKKGKKSKGVRLRQMSPEERLLAAVFGQPDPRKFKIRAEREAAMFAIELDNLKNDVLAVLMGDKKPRLYRAPSGSPHLTFRAMLDFFASQKFYHEARDNVQNVLFMLAQLARKIGSCAFEDVLRLRIECATSCSFTRAKADRLAARFAECWNLVMAEYELLDDKERANVSVRQFRENPDFVWVVNPYLKSGMTAEETNAAERKFALERLHRRIPHYLESIGMLREIVSRAADQIAAGEPFDETMDELFANFRTLRDVLATETDIYYNVSNAEDGVDKTAHERTDETSARESLVAELDRLFDAAAAAAQQIGSRTALGFVDLKMLLDSRKGDFSVPEADEYCEYSRYLDESQRLEIRNDLRRFLVGFENTYQDFLRHVAAAKLGGEKPLKVELTKKSGETIAKAVRPGRGGARRIYDEDIQEKCWHYWETGRRNPDVAQGQGVSGRKVTHADVFRHYRRELGALEPPVDTPEAFKSVLRARTNRIGRKKSH